MKTLTLALAALLLLATTAAYAQEEPGFEDMELRIFDISSVVTPEVPQFGPRLGPLNAHGYEEQYDSDPERYFEGDALADLIRETVVPESWDRDWADVQYREGGKLIVRNVPEVVSKVGALIGDLSAGASRRVLLTAELWELPAAAVDQVLAGSAPSEVANASRIASGSTETRPGVQTVLKVTNRVRYMSEYDVEIAQGSSLSDPIVMAPDEGFALDVLPRVTLGGDRLILQCYQQSGRFLRPFRTVELGVDEEYFAKEFRSDRRYSNGRLELPVYEEANAFFTRVVASGRAFVVPVVRDGKLFALRITARVVGRGGLAGLYDLGTLSGRWRNPWFGFPEEFEPDYVGTTAPCFHDTGEYETRMFEGAEEVMDLIVQNVKPPMWESGDSVLGITGMTRLYVHAEDDLRQAVESFLRAREDESVAPISLDVSVFSVPGDLAAGEGPDAPPEGATLRYRTRLDTLPHLRTGVQAGNVAAFLADYDVEVAQEARIADPIVGQSFAGLVGNFTPWLSADGGRITVELGMLLCHRGSIGSFVSGTQYLGPVDRFDTARTVLNQTLQMANGGSYWIDAGTDPLDPHRRMAVRVTARAGE